MKLLHVSSLSVTYTREGTQAKLNTTLAVLDTGLVRIFSPRRVEMAKCLLSSGVLKLRFTAEFQWMTAAGALTMHGATCSSCKAFSVVHFGERGAVRRPHCRRTTQTRVAKQVRPASSSPTYSNSDAKQSQARKHTRTQRMYYTKSSVNQLWLGCLPVAKVRSLPSSGTGAPQPQKASLVQQNHEAAGSGKHAAKLLLHQSSTIGDHPTCILSCSRFFERKHLG